MTLLVVLFLFLDVVDEENVGVFYSLDDLHKLVLRNIYCELMITLGFSDENLRFNWFFGTFIFRLNLFGTTRLNF